MRATFTSEQEQLAAIAADMGAKGLEAARSMVRGEGLASEPTTSLMAGFAGLGVPESAGGAGGGLVDLAIVVEGLARSVTPTPFVSHAAALQLALGAGFPIEAGAGGEVRLVAAAVPSPARDGDFSAGGPVGGVVRAVPDGVGAEDVVALDHEGRVAIARVINSTPRPGLDQTRPTADLVLDGEGVGRPVGDGALRAAVIVAADLCGVGRGAVFHGAEYAKEREQFGQPIGKFQGVAHQLAEALAFIEAAWSLTLYAAWALDAEAPDAMMAAHAAKARAGEAAVHGAERAMQVHGGIGITWEAQVHLFLRRAIASDAWMGGRSAHRRALGAAVLGGAV